MAYMKAENSDRIKRALSSRIYASDGPFYYGEKVFYWKESVNKSARGWKGPGTVVGTEGKVVIIASTYRLFAVGHLSMAFPVECSYISLV